MPGPVIDIDSHIWENLPLMAEYLDPKYRDLALSIQVDDRGLEYMSVEGRMPHNLFLREGRFGRMAAGKSIEEKRDLYLKPGAVTYEQGLINVPASHQPGPRVQVLRSGRHRHLLHLPDPRPPLGNRRSGPQSSRRLRPCLQRIRLRLLQRLPGPPQAHRPHHPPGHRGRHR